MPKFSKQSKNNLSQCHPNLIRLFTDVVEHFDCSVICGHRGAEEQEAAYKAGKSKARFGESKHNYSPALAADVIPYPVDWYDRERFAYFAGFVKARAVALGINIRWGGDWDQDHQTKDEAFSDMPHFELID